MTLMAAPGMREYHTAATVASPGNQPGGEMPADAPAPQPTTAPAARRFAHPRFALFLISFSILFFELTCIRWFGSTVVFLTFFTNIVLLASVLGMSAGCLAASRRRDYLD